jgi:UDP-2,3-diacylglucosamine hydrolase
MERVGLIAGNGRFPLIFSRAARLQGYCVVAVAHQGETEPDLEGAVDHLTWIRVGQLEPIVTTFRANGVRRAVMAGGIHKAGLLRHFEPDERGVRLLSRLGAWSDDALLRELAAELEAEGIDVVASTLFLESLLTPEGALTSHAVTEQQWRDIRHGLAAARGIGRWDIGQTVVVKSGMVLAVEAVEGTDATLRRGGELGRGGAVAVKVSKPGQDLRFDVPAVGPETVRTCRAAGVDVLALEAGRTLLLERDELLAAAQSCGLAVVGVRADEP